MVPKANLPQRITPEQDRHNLRLCLGAVATNRDLYLLTIRKCGLIQAPEPTIPTWASNCFDSIWQTSFRNVPVFTVDLEGDLRTQGAFVGFFVWWQKQLKGLEIIFERLESLRPPLSRLSEKKFNAACEKMFLIDGVVTPKFLKEVDDLSEAKVDVGDFYSSGTMTDIVSFSEGLSVGTKGPSGTEEGDIKETDATQIYMFLFMYWRQIIEFKSITQLHRVLLRIFGPNRVGDKKRIEQICARIGLRLRGRGRPKKTLTVEKA